MKIEEVLFEVAKLEPKKQNAFLESLKGVLSDKELEAVAIGISYFRQLLDPKLKKAMMDAVAKELLKA